MQQIKKNIKESISDKNAVLLFTGDIGSTLLINIVKDLTTVQAGMNIQIVFIDTGYHFKETMDYIKKTDSRVKTIKNKTVSIVPTTRNDMDKCCTQRKTVTLKEYLDDIKAECLVVPFRDDEKLYEVEDSYLKSIDNIEIIRPLVDLTERDIWTKIKEHNLSFSSIYNKGYRFVDCKPCTTRFGRKKQSENHKNEVIDKEIEEKLKSLGYL